MTCHVLRAFVSRFSLQVIHEPIVEIMRVFSRATDVGKYVTRQTADGFRFKGFWFGAIQALQIENRLPQKLRETFAFCRTIHVDVGESLQRLAEDCEQFMVRYMSVVPI